MKSLFSIVTMLVLGLSLSAQTETNDRAGLQSKMENGQILLEKSFFNMGIIYNTEIKTSNTGKSDLEIRHIKTSCSCIAASSTLSSIKPDEKASIKASFNTKGKHGKQTKTNTVTTSDPSQPKVEISMIGEVLDPPNVIKPVGSPVNINATPKN